MSVTYLDEPVVGKGVTYLDEDVTASTPDIGIDESPFQVPRMKLGVIPDAPPEHPVITSRDPMQRFAQNSANLQRAKYIQQRKIRADELQNRINEGYPVSPNEVAMYGDLLELNEPPKPKKEKVPKGIYAGEQTAQMEQFVAPEQPRTYTPDTRTPISLAEQTGVQDYVEPATVQPIQPTPTQNLPMGANETYGQIAERATRGVAMSALGAGVDIAQGVWDTIKGVGDKAIGIGEGLLEPIIRSISRPSAGESPQIVPSSWERNALGKLDYYVSGMIGDVKEYTQNMRDNIHDELKDNYGTAVDITQTGAEMLSAATVMIGGMQAVAGVAPTTSAELVPQIAHGAALGYTITPGDAKEKQEGALIMGLFSAAGPLADKVIPSAALAKLSAVVANNLVSIPQYNAIVQNAKAEAEAEGTSDNWLMKAALPLAEAGAWTFMGMSAKGKPKTANKINDVIIKAWSPEKWAKVTKALDMPLLKVVEPPTMPNEAITAPETPPKVAIAKEPIEVAPPAEIGAKVPLEPTTTAKVEVSPKTGVEGIMAEFGAKPVTDERLHMVWGGIVSDGKPITVKAIEQSTIVEKGDRTIEQAEKWIESQGYVREGDTYVYKPEAKQPVVEQAKPTIEEKPDALQVKSTAEMDVRKQAPDGETVAKGNAKVQGVAGETITKAQGNGAEVKPKSIDFEVRYTTKEGNRGKTWVQAKDAQTATSIIQKEFNTEGTGEKVTSAIKSKMDLTTVTPEGKQIVEPRLITPKERANLIYEGSPSETVARIKAEETKYKNRQKELSLSTQEAQRIAKMTDKELAEYNNNLKKTTKLAKPPAEQGKSLGAAAMNRLKNVTVDVAEPGKNRLRGFLDTLKKSAKVTEGAKKELGKLEPDYEQQRTKEMKDRVLNWFTENPLPKEVESKVSEAETMVRNPQEDLDTKGAVGVALLEHYRNTGNDKASVDLAEHLDPLMRGAGRLNQAASMMNQLTGNGWIQKMNTYLEGKKVKLPEDVQKQVELEFKLSSKIKDEKVRQEALNKTIAKVASYVPFKVGEWIDAYRYTNMLSNPQSHERNVWGNTVQALITRPLSLMANGNFSGTKNYLAKAWGSALSGKAFSEARKSFNTDFSKFAESLDTPNASIFDTIRMEQGPQGKKKQVAWKALTAIPKLLNAQDKFFGAMIEAGEITRLVKQGKSAVDAQAIARKLSDKYLYRDKLGKNRDKSLPAASQAIDGLANLLEKGRTTENPYVRWPMKFTVPFLRTPMRIAQFGIEASPLAWLGPRMNVENISKSKYGKSFEKLSESEQTIVREDLNNRRGLASVGTMVTLLGVGAAMQGNTTWGAPQDPEAKKLFYASGRRPYSFKVGDKWIPMAYLGPFFLAFALPAAVRDSFADNPNTVNESTLTKIGLSAASIPKVILTQTPLASVNGFLEALQGKVDTTVASAIGFQGGQFVPTSGLLRWVNKIADPTYRKPISIQETIEAGIPGLSKDVQAYQDEVGGDAKRPWTDIYLPYTMGTVNKESESDYVNKMEILKAKMKYKKEKQKALREQKRQ
jgi:hypothetical protein